MARYLLLFVFGAIFVKTLANSSSDVFVWLAKTSLLLERSLRITQALAILTLVALLRLVCDSVWQELERHLVRLQSVHRHEDWSVRFVVVLVGTDQALLGLCGNWFLSSGTGIWTATLWSAQPVPQTQRDAPLESDYELLLHATRAQFRRTLARLGWAARA